MPIQQQTQPSQIQVKINYMKSQDMIARLRSKASYINYGPNNISVVATIIDGYNLTVQTDNGIEDWTSSLIGQTVNLRLSDEQWEALNAELHECEGVGAEVVYNLSDNVRYDILNTKKDGEVWALAVYPDDIVEVEPLQVQKVGSVRSADELRAGLEANRKRNEAKRQEAISTRVARNSADQANDVAARRETLNIK